MDDNLRQLILAASSRESTTFQQEFKLPFGDALVDASVCCGNEARPLAGVVGQPTTFPQGSYLQLPIEVNSRVTADDFIKRNLPGCQLELSGGCKKSGPRPLFWTLSCKCHRIAKPLNQSDFEDGCVAKKGTLKESVKRIEFDHMNGCIVDATQAKKRKKKRKRRVSDQASHGKRQKQSHSRPASNRTSSYRAKEKKDRCPMKITLFKSASDDRFYVGSNSNLTHRGHPYLSPSAANRSSSELTSDDIELIELLNGKIGPQSIANILNERHDGEMARANSSPKPFTAKYVSYNR